MDQRLIGEVPGLALADVDLGNDLALGADAAVDLAFEVVIDELGVGGVEAEAGGKGLEGERLQRRRRPEVHRAMDEDRRRHRRWGLGI